MVDASTRPSCSTCIFFQLYHREDWAKSISEDGTLKAVTPRGECRADAPRRSRDSHYSNEGTWLEVYGSGWCGRHRRTWPSVE